VRARLVEPDRNVSREIAKRLNAACACLRDRKLPCKMLVPWESHPVKMM
jgi:hypothetical protein